MKKTTQILLTFLVILPVYAFDMSEEDSEVFEHFYNYRFDETIAYLESKIRTSDYPYPYYAFLSYADIRSRLANAEYDSLNIKTDAMIRKFRPHFETYLQEHPEDVDAQFYYTVLLGGKMRIYLQEMKYFAIIREGPKILSNKITIDHYADEPYADLDFGTGSFDYYLSVIGRNAGFEILSKKPQSNGIDDLWNAYRHAKFTDREAAIALMYIYLYDKTDYEQCESLCKDFLSKYPDNLEVLAIASENACHRERWLEGNRYLRHLERLLNKGILHNDKGWRSRVNYLKGIRAMLKDDHPEALNHLNKVFERDAIEYSWYRAIVPKYIADIYLDMGLKRTAELYYKKAVDSNEMIPHVREAKDTLKYLRKMK